MQNAAASWKLHCCSSVLEQALEEVDLAGAEHAACDGFRRRRNKERRARRQPGHACTAHRRLRASAFACDAPPEDKHKYRGASASAAAAAAAAAMDVTFETARGRRFTVEVWYFATVREVKEAIHRREGIPVASQRLFLAGRELDDDARAAADYSVLQGSRLLLLLPEDTPAAAAAAAAPPAVRVAVSAPAIGRTVALDLRAADTVARLKELLQDRTDGAAAAARTALFFGKAEMEDGKALAEYGPPVDGMMEVAAVVRQPSAPAGAAAGGGAGSPNSKNNQPPPPPPQQQQQRMAVKLQWGSKAVALEVGAMDAVRDLRREVERAAPQLRLPERDGGGGGGGGGHGYFFVYKRSVMEEDRTLRWHDVKSGDTIEIFNGSVTGGA
ncbi:hypothetical protein ACP4OV_013828 [Aristida adscensionis]